MNAISHGTSMAAVGILSLTVVVSAIARTAPVVPAGKTFACTATAVWDGDGPIWCAEGPKVRLAGIAAREIDGSCRPGQPCPSASGPAARDRLVALLGGARGQWRDGHILVNAPRMFCQSAGQGKGDRTAAWCSSPGGRDLSCAMLASHTVLRWVRYDPADRCRAGGRL